jgi:hypothetical protein
MHWSQAIAAFAAFVHVCAYGIYGRQVLSGLARPNPATWTLWVALSALNAASYIIMSGDPAKGTVATAGAVSCTVVLGIALRRGAVAPLGRWDRAALASGLAAGAAWVLLRSATWANLILQAGFFISMLPTYRAVAADPSAERPLPWLLWGLAYAMNVFVVSSRWTGSGADLVYPLLNLCTHAGVGLLAITLAARRRAPASA